MLDIMHIPDEEFKDLIGDSETLIMSEGLEVEFGEAQEETQSLTLDSSNIKFVCSLTSASSIVTSDIKGRVWRFELEVPGLSFGDLSEVTKITYNFNNKTFESISNFAWAITEMGSVITFTAQRIFNNNE